MRRRATEEAPVNGWKLLRRGHALRVEVEPSALEQHEEGKIISAVEDEAAGDGFDVVHVTGPALEGPADGTRALIRNLADVAKRHGKRLDVGPI
jgi:hypothetical protein